VNAEVIPFRLQTMHRQTDRQNSPPKCLSVQWYWQSWGG